MDLRVPPILIYTLVTVLHVGKLFQNFEGKLKLNSTNIFVLLKMYSQKGSFSFSIIIFATATAAGWGPEQMGGALSKWVGP